MLNTEIGYGKEAIMEISAIPFRNIQGNVKG